ncbi:IS982 family transposase, partial [Clostridium tarantellae]
MLDYNNYFIGEIENLKDFFTITYVIIDDIYNKLIPNKVKHRRNVSDSKLSDTEIITISLVGEAMTIDSEKAWFNFVKKNFKELFPNIGDRSRFNRTKRNLYTVIYEIQSKFFSENKFGDNSIRIVDSMPVPVCNFGRAYFSKSFKDISSYGYCASKKESYFGLKLHALITTKGFITDFILTAANVDDRDALWELTESYKDIKIIGDKGYVSTEIGKQLALEQNISLLALQRKNSKTQFPK